MTNLISQSWLYISFFWFAITFENYFLYLLMIFEALCNMKPLVFQKLEWIFDGRFLGQGIYIYIYIRQTSNERCKQYVCRWVVFCGAQSTLMSLMTKLWSATNKKHTKKHRRWTHKFDKRYLPQIYRRGCL